MCCLETQVAALWEVATNAGVLGHATAHAHLGELLQGLQNMSLRCSICKYRVGHGGACQACNKWGNTSTGQMVHPWTVFHVGVLLRSFTQAACEGVEELLWSGAIPRAQHKLSISGSLDLKLRKWKASSSSS